MLPVLGEPVDELWDVFLDLGERLRADWTIVGGQMVLLHALEHGVVPPTVSQDGDVIADIRSAPRSLRKVTSQLERLGFELAGMDRDGTAHRYRRASSRSGGRDVVIDLLAPEGIGERADLTTTPPGRTIQVPGGTQALRRTERIRVQVGRRLGEVPRPSLLGAIVGKAAACGIPATTQVGFRCPKRFATRAGQPGRSSGRDDVELAGARSRPQSGRVSYVDCRAHEPAAQRRPVPESLLARCANS